MLIIYHPLPPFPSPNCLLKGNDCLLGTEKQCIECIFASGCMWLEETNTDGWTKMAKLKWLSFHQKWFFAETNFFMHKSSMNCKVSECVNRYFETSWFHHSWTISDALFQTIQNPVVKNYQKLAELKKLSFWQKWFFSASSFFMHTFNMSEMSLQSIKLLQQIHYNELISQRIHYSQISIARTLMAHSPWLIRTRFVCLCWGFYGPVNPMGSCRAQSVYLTTRLLGRLSPLSG